MELVINFFDILLHLDTYLHEVFCSMATDVPDFFHHYLL